MTKIVSNYTTNFDDELEISKTKLKAHMHDLQDVGIELTKLSEQKLAKFDLPIILIDAINLAKKIKSNGALRRQYQYLGKLMRNVDFEYVKNKLAEVNYDSVTSVKRLHTCEKWREKMLIDDNAASQFISQYPSCNETKLKELILNSKSENTTRRTKSMRELFRFLRDIMEKEI